MALTKIPSSLLDTTSGLSLSGDITLVDNDKVIFGAGSDLQIYHNGSDSFIRDVGTGNLKILGDNVQIMNSAGTETQILSVSDSGVVLYHNGVAKFETTSTGIDVTGNIVVSGTVDGRDVATDGTKLDTIETNADVTDTTNVTAAGALMDSEITNLAQVKAFDSSDYATAAQGSTADSALQNIVEDTTPQLGGTLDTNNQLIQFGDSSGSTVNRLRFGASSDLQIYHTGSSSIVRDTGTGDLFVGGTNLRLTNGDMTATYLQGIDGGAVDIRYNNAVKLATTATGINVTGNIVVSGTVDGRDVATDGTKLDGIEANATADQTQSEINALGITATGLSGTPNITVGTISSGVHTITSSGTIGGAAVANGYLKITDNTHTMAFDTNEIHTTDNLYLLAEAGNIIFRDTGNGGVVLKNGVTQFMDASRNLTNIGTISSGAITSTGAIQGASFSDGTISGITFIDEDSFATNSATRVPTQQSIKAYVDTQVAGVVDSAPAALDTLNELAAALGDDANFSTTTSTALGNRLRVDTAAQGLTGTQQANAITNLGITATKAELNYVDGVTSNIQTQLDGKQASGSYLTGNQTITLSGDVSGSGTTSIAVTIADDSHNHVISNVDGLQTALDAKLASSSYTAADVLTKIKTVDGAGSGLDADLLDGISSASFLRSDADDTHSGTLTVTTALNIADSNTSLEEGLADTLRIQTGTGYIDIGSKNTSYVHFETDRSKFYFDSAVHFAGQIYNYVSGGTSDPYWRAGNDGAGSGLDADLLDGQQGSYYAPASTALTTSTSFGGDVSGTYNAIVVADDSHNHVISNVDGLQTALDGKTSLDHIRSLGAPAFTGGTDPNITTAQYISEMEGDGAFDSYSSIFKTSWSYAGNYNLSDAGSFGPTETAGMSHITWTDNSSDIDKGHITVLAIAPTTGGSAGGVYVYNDQGSSYTPGWREIWTSSTDGAGSGLDADLLDAQQGSYYLNYNNFTNTPTIPSLSGYATESYVGTQISNLVDSSPAALNTLNELAAALGDDANFSTTTSTALGNRLRVDTAAQGLTGTQQANAITNLGITATKAELNYVDGVTSNIQTQLNGKQATGSYLTGNQTITLSGDVSGSGTTSIAVTIADDSHNHVISNVDGLQTALDAKLASSSYTASDVLTKIKTVDGPGSGLDADLLDGISSASFLRSDANDTLTGAYTFTNNTNLQIRATTNATGAGIDFSDHAGGSYAQAGSIEFFHSDSMSYGSGASFILGSTETTTTILADGKLMYAEGIYSKPGSGTGAGTRKDSNWDTAYGWGNHASAGYITGNQTITLSGDVSGSGTTSIAVTIADDSHNHVISNVDGLQTALDAKLPLAGGAMTGPITTNSTFDGRDIATDGAKLDGIAAGANNYSFPYTVSASAGNNTVVQRNSSGYIFSNYFNGTGTFSTTGATSGMGRFTGTNGTDTYGRSYTAAAARTLLNVENGATADQTAAEILTAIKTVDGAGSGLDADNLDGLTWTSSGKNVRATEFYADNWFRNYNSSEGIYNQATGQHFYSDHDDYWNIAGGTTANGLRFRDEHAGTVRGYVYANNSSQIGFLNSSGSWSLKCDNSGNVIATGNVTAYSDERLKDNILVIDNALEKVSQLRGVTFNRTDTEEPHRHTGVIAQEVEKVLPEAVITADDEMQTKSVAYGNMVGLLIEAIKELKTEVNDLKKQLKEIK